MTFAPSKPSSRPVSAVVQELRRILAFFGPTRLVEIESRFDVPTSLERVMRLDETGKVYVRREGDTIRVCCSHQGPRANVLPFFIGKFESQGQKVVLKGQIGVDSGVRFAIAFIGFFIFIFFPIGVALGKAKDTSPGGGYFNGVFFNFNRNWIPQWQRRYFYDPSDFRGNFESA